MRARRTRLMKNAGPYHVNSRADGSLVIVPKWPEYEPEGDWHEEGGGPGLFTRAALAGDIEAFLNAPWEATK